MAGGRRVLWAALVALVIAGAVGYELVDEELTPYPISWEQSTITHDSTEATLDEGETYTWDVLLRFSNVTEVRARLAWTDDAGEPDRFRVNLDRSNGSTVAEVEGAQSPLEAATTLREIPQRETVEATSPEAALRQAHRDHTTLVEETWTVTVELLEAPGQSPAEGAPETQSDGSNGFALTFEVVTYEGRLAEG